ncbi:DDE_3 domain-containing protein [Trichonephila clavipes]|nr:DDE_3 domain-containing protein [Trichonephila clavipes]
MGNGKTAAHGGDGYFFERGIVAAVKYREEVLEPYVRLFNGAVGPGFIKGRTTRITKKTSGRQISGNWRYSPDALSYQISRPYSYKTHLGRSGREIRTRNPSPRTIQGLKTELLNEWDSCTHELINFLTSIVKSWREV